MPRTPERVIYHFSIFKHGDGRVPGIFSHADTGREVPIFWHVPENFDGDDDAPTLLLPGLKMLKFMCLH